MQVNITLRREEVFDRAGLFDSLVLPVGVYATWRLVRRQNVPRPAGSSANSVRRRALAEPERRRQDRV